MGVAKRRRGLDRRPEVSLGGPAPRDHVRVAQPLEHSRVRLPRVEQTEEGVARDIDAGLVLPAPDVLLEDLDPRIEERQEGGHLDVAAELQLGDGLQPRGAARIPDHENEVALADPLPGPLEVVGGGERGAVLVQQAEEREVERVAGIGEVVGFAAEEAEPQLRGHDQRGPGVAPEDVRGVEAAVVERHHLDLDPGLLPTALPLDPRGHRLGHAVPRRRARLRAHRRVDRRAHLQRDVHDVDQLVGLEVGHTALVGQRGRVEAVVEEVLAVLRDLRDEIAHAVVVGQDESVGRHQGGRAAGDPERAEAGPRVPVVAGREAVGLLQVRGGRGVEGPHLAVVERAGAHGVEAGRGGGGGGDGGRRRDERCRGHLLGRRVPVGGRRRRRGGGGGRGGGAGRDGQQKQGGGAVAHRLVLARVAGAATGAGPRGFGGRARRSRRAGRTLQR